MLKKHLVLLGISIAILLLLIAIARYPGGSRYDQHAVGFNWTENYLSNLFHTTAINGQYNSAMPWAIAGVLLLSISIGLFFYRFSKKIPLQSATRVIQYVGMGSMLCCFLVVTPLHDLMVTLSGTAILITLFYITVFLFKAKLFFLKIFAIICLLFFYSTVYIYSTRNYEVLLPLMQKLTLLMVVTWIICVEYATTPADFIACTPKKQKLDV